MGKNGDIDNEPDEVCNKYVKVCDKHNNTGNGG